METRHLNSLMSILDGVLEKGYGEIRKSSLRSWYSRERITKPVWRDICQKWAEAGGDSPLFIGDLEGSYVLIYGRGLVAKKDAWFKPLVEWAEISDRETVTL